MLVVHTHNHTHADFGFLSLSARPSLARKSAILTNCPILLEQNRATGNGRSSFNSWTKKEEKLTLNAGNKNKEKRCTKESKE